VMLRARVAKRQLAPAAAATKQARQQSVAVADTVIKDIRVSRLRRD
jgi:hypothetical protein